jgi:hypothetical protein
MNNAERVGIRGEKNFSALLTLRASPNNHS